MEGQLTLRRSTHPVRFPNAIRRYRTQAGLSQKHLAALLGQGRGCVSAWERGLRLPNLVSAFRLAKTLGTLTEALYFPLYSPQHPDSRRPVHPPRP